MLSACECFACELDTSDGVEKDGQGHGAAKPTQSGLCYCLNAKTTDGSQAWWYSL